MSGSAAPIGVSAEPPPGQGRYRFVNVEFDDVEGLLRVDGRVVTVEPRPLRLLTELLHRVDEVVSKEELLDTVWDGRPTVDHVLANAVSKLRAALGEQGAARLVTVPRIGYKLEGPVQRLASRAPDQHFAPGQPVPGREGFVLERALGQGGHVDVWLARHGKLGQPHVFKFAHSAARLASIKREYTLYRLLREELGPRDDFARVIDSNFTAPPYFLECAFGGQSLLEWALQDGRLLAMAPADRLMLFLQIAQAVAAAHSVGVLHKDIKPGNVLIDGRPGAYQARLTDLGSGRLLDGSRLDALQLTALGMTEAGAAGTSSRSGTLIYMAPELLAGQAASVQSDVYALGLLLYQVLAGDLQRAMATGWQRDVPDPLLQDAIAGATEGRPAERLKTVPALVDLLQTLDARRSAAAERVRQETAAAQVLEQLRQTRARRPWVVAGVVGMALGLVASLGFSQQSRRALALAESESLRVQAINRFLNDDLLTGIDVAGAGKEGTVSMRTVLTRASARAAQRFAGQPRTEAVVRGQLALSLSRLSMFDEAEAEYRRALALADPTDVATDPALLKLRYGLISHLAVHNKLKEATSLLELADRDSGARIHVKQPDAQDALPMLAANARTQVLHSSGRHAEALLAAQRLVVLADAQAAERTDVPFTSRVVLADVQFRLGKNAEAEKLLQDITSAPGAADTVDAVTLARAQVALGRVRVALGQGDKAEAVLLAARDELVSRLGAGEHWANVADAELGGLYDSRGDFARSAQYFQAAYDGFERGFGKDHPSTAVQSLNLAIAELNMGRPDPALQKLNSGRDWFIKYMGGDKSPTVQAIDFERARALSSLGRAAEAFALLAGLDPKALTAAAPARDWQWRLQAERGRAKILAGARDEGFRLLLPTLKPMAESGTPLWALTTYRKLAASTN
jgi:eukaryotic-like serine/threonine-protein kinase